MEEYTVYYGVLREMLSLMDIYLLMVSHFSAHYRHRRRSLECLMCNRQCFLLNEYFMY